MWINTELFKRLMNSAEATELQLSTVSAGHAHACTERDILREQRAKDEMTIDWMRHRINALEKERAVLLQSSTRLVFPVPEIASVAAHGKTSVFANAKTSNHVPTFDSMPSFEDVGEEVAQEMGISHHDDGTLKYKD